MDMRDRCEYRLKVYPAIPGALCLEGTVLIHSFPNPIFIVGQFHHPALDIAAKRAKNMHDTLKLQARRIRYMAQERPKGGLNTINPIRQPVDVLNIRGRTRLNFGHRRNHLSNRRVSHQDQTKHEDRSHKVSLPSVHY